MFLGTNLLCGSFAGETRKLNLPCFLFQDALTPYFANFAGNRRNQW